MCVSGKTYDITVCDSLYILLECYEACEDAPQFVLGPWRLPLLESLFGLKALRPRNVVQPPPASGGVRHPANAASWSTDEEKTPRVGALSMSR